MLCPLLPGIANSRDQIDELVEFLLKECGVEEVFCEPVNGRGKGLTLPKTLSGLLDTSRRHARFHL